MLPEWNPDLIISYRPIALLEGILTLQLIFAWKAEKKRFSPVILYLLLGLFCFRLVYRMSVFSPVLWGFRAAVLHNPFWGILWYGVGIVLLHPSALRGLESYCASISTWPRTRELLVTLAGFVLLFFLFSVLSSRNISHDGRDWILRTTKPVWHQYLREPLTIGLYRAVYLAARPVFHLTSYQVLSYISMLSGVWSLFWFHLMLRESKIRLIDKVSGWLLIFSSGGMMILFFGHIEVYPVFIAGILPALYGAQQYLLGKRNIGIVAVIFSIALLLHLSAGWLIPAFLALPFVKRNGRSSLRDVLIFLTVFAVIQLFFWWSLVFLFYGDWRIFLARLHETFYVGPDRAMFLPGWALLHPQHLWDLFNESLYLSMAGLLLIPPALFRFFQCIKRENLFWVLLPAGYSIYFLIWHPDRGFPEDWDLFSPLVPLVILFQMQVFIGGDFGEEEKGGKGVGGFSYLSLYIAAVGTLPHTIQQIWYHHIVPFIPG